MIKDAKLSYHCTARKFYRERYELLFEIEIHLTVTKY